MSEDDLIHVRFGEMAAFFRKIGAEITPCPACGFDDKLGATEMEKIEPDKVYTVITLQDAQQVAANNLTYGISVSCDRCGYTVEYSLAPFLREKLDGHG